MKKMIIPLIMIILSISSSVFAGCYVLTTCRDGGNVYCSGSSCSANGSSVSCDGCTSSCQQK